VSENERRQFTRFPFDGQISFSHDGKEFEAKLVDISLKGALVELDNNWDLGRADNIDFSLLLNEQSLNIEFQGNIVHIEDKRIGISVEHIEIESASHLKRLVELNLGDSLLLARELSAMC